MGCRALLCRALIPSDQLTKGLPISNSFRLFTAIVVVLLFSLVLTACEDVPTDEISITEGTADAVVVGSFEEDSTQSEPQEGVTVDAVGEPIAKQVVRIGRVGDEPFAPELTGVDSWINSEPLTLGGLRGKVVLIDFWTYTCINCIRTLSYLNDWHDKYSGRGLTIIGVHTPEFEFEKKKANVIHAIGEFGLKYPVVQDNDYGTWRAYSNRYWPAKYLIDKDGYIRYRHFGEGAYQETEELIRDLLTETSTEVHDIPLDVRPRSEIDTDVYAASSAATSLTREIYAGYNRNYSAMQLGGAPPYVLPRVYPEYYGKSDLVMQYTDPGEHDNHFLYIQGLWVNGKESLRHARVTSDYEDYVALRFYATTVNVVISLEENDPYDVRVTLDNQPLRADQTGTDIMYDDYGNSYIKVDESRMYRLVSTSSYGGHDLRLSSNSDDFYIFAFTFGAYAGGAES